MAQPFESITTVFYVRNKLSGKFVGRYDILEGIENIEQSKSFPSVSRATSFVRRYISSSSHSFSYYARALERDNNPLLAAYESLGVVERNNKNEIINLKLDDSMFEIVTMEVTKKEVHVGSFPKRRK